MITRKFDVFTTDQLTKILGLDPKKDKWRVIKFVQSREYNIAPSISDASGPGTRRLYDIEDVCALALALRILETGLRSKAIGKVIRQLREKGKLSVKLELDDTELENLKLVVVRIPEPGKPLDESRFQRVTYLQGVEKVVKLVHQTFRDSVNEYDMILVPMGATLLGVKHRLTKMKLDLAKEKS